MTTKSKAAAVAKLTNGKPETAASVGAKPPVGKKGGKTAIAKTTLRDENDKAVGVTFEFDNGKGFTLTLADLDAHPDIIAELACHGISQKIGDAAAKSSGATIGEKFDACEAVYLRLREGDWAARRENAGEGVTGGLLAKALAEVTSKPVDEVRAFLKPLGKAERDALTRDATVKPIYDRMKAERDAAKAAKAPEVNTGNLLAGLMGKTA